MFVQSRPFFFLNAVCTELPRVKELGSSQTWASARCVFSSTDVCISHERVSGGPEKATAAVLSDCSRLKVVDLIEKTKCPQRVIKLKT